MPASASPSPPAGQDTHAAAAPCLANGDSFPPRTRSPSLPRRAHICPEPGSLYDIMRSYPGYRLYVLPIRWTDIHTESLGVRFKQQSPIISPEPQRYPSMPPTPSPEPSAVAKQLCAKLNAFIHNPVLTDKIRALNHLLSDFYPDIPCKTKTSKDLDLHFGTKFYRKAVKVPVVWKRTGSRRNSSASAAAHTISSSQKSTSSECGLNGIRGANQHSASKFARDAPLLAYIDRDQLASERRTLFHVSPGPCNTPVANLQRLQAKALAPSDRDCDAYFIAVLIALGQARFYSKTGPTKFKLSQSASPNMPTSSDNSQDPNQPDSLMNNVEVRLFTFDTDNEDFIVYTASIGADFLEGFAQPSRRLHQGPEGASSMHVSYTKVPAWPLYGLKERLGRALGAEITGSEFSAPGYDTFHTPEELAEVERIRREEELRYHEHQVWREKVWSNSSSQCGKKRSSSRGGSGAPSKRRHTRRRM